ncbi:MAG: hypothetical protein LBR36_08625 [Bacteroidales bacterium]|jgi:hypothetical protein|nr:hypothetical protein [Bacteroidales bacterium]
MKRLALFAGALCFVLASCTPKEETSTVECQDSTKQEVKKCDGKEKPCCKMTEEEKAACEAFKAKWDNWENLAETEKAELVKELKTKIDQKEAEMAAKKAEMEAKKAEMEAKWKAFDKLTLDEQKALLEAKMSCCKKGPKDCGKNDKPCCKKGEEGKECPKK